MKEPLTYKRIQQPKVVDAESKIRMETPSMKDIKLKKACLVNR